VSSVAATRAGSSRASPSVHTNASLRAGRRRAAPPGSALGDVARDELVEAVELPSVEAEDAGERRPSGNFMSVLQLPVQAEVLGQRGPQR